MIATTTGSRRANLRCSASTPMPRCSTRPHRSGRPPKVPVLDVGAGTGRNALPLARLGHPTYALEMVQSLADVMRKDAEEEKLPVTVIVDDVTAPNLVLPRNDFKLIFLAEVIASHFGDSDAVRRAVANLAPALAPGGLLLFSTFLARDGYKPDLDGPADLAGRVVVHLYPQRLRFRPRGLPARSRGRRHGLRLREEPHGARRLAAHGLVQRVVPGPRPVRACPPAKHRWISAGSRTARSRSVGPAT